jgi:hypothetical protein
MYGLILRNVLIEIKSGFWVGNLLMLVNDYLLEVESNGCG